MAPLCRGTLARIYRMPWRDFWVAFAWLLVSTFIMSYAMNYVDARMPSPDADAVLPDIVQEVWSVPQNSTAGQWISIASNVLFAGNAATCAVVVLTHYKYRCLPIFTKWLTVMGAAYFLRIFFLFSTALPPTADIKCRYTQPRAVIENYLTNALIGVLTLGNGNIHCGDLFYSGHGILVCCSWMAALRHLRHFPIVVVLVSVCALGNLLLIIVHQNHYTMDVITSAYVTCTLWILHPLRRAVYLDPAWYLSWGPGCATCWVSEHLPDEEEDSLLGLETVDPVAVHLEPRAVDV
eukprot:TRINITY_DN3018_c0_g1_i5.p1 TRINITY_DN3018_c0_g1~~TRINITY_DN3018_c0_g1_i5.p1  ORF type:complete len:324 (-),score=79.88 TRINITY_DN3018_c0_g1_i5:375-1253(-)